MTETKTISDTDWADVCAGATGNPMAEQEILAMAKRGELLIKDEGRLYVPVPEGGAWRLIRALTEDDIAQELGLRHPDVHRLLLEADVPSFFARERLFSPQPLWAEADLNLALTAYAAQTGLEEREAALELGLTIDSYRRVANSIPFASHGRVLKPMLEAFRNKFLPKDTIWSTQTAITQEFVQTFNRGSSVGPLRVQFCDVSGCGHAASAQCCNPKCRKDKEPRFLCPAHAKWVDVTDAIRRPPSLCATCAAAVQEGQLKGFRLL
jgi:hypothetical protein